MNDQAVVPAPKAAIAMTDRGIELRTFDDLQRFANMIVSSGIGLPEGMKNAPALAVAIELGMNVGLRPLQAIQSIAVINGRPSIWGKAGTALILRSGTLESAPLEEWTGGEDTSENMDFKATCIMRRKGMPGPFIGEFTVRQAKQMGLLGKQTYRSGLKDMLMWRARWRAYVAGFSDILLGLTIAEVAYDEPLDPIVGGRAEVLPAEEGQPRAKPRSLDDIVARAATAQASVSPASPAPETTPDEPAPGRSAGPLTATEAMILEEPRRPVDQRVQAAILGRYRWKPVKGSPFELEVPYDIPDVGVFLSWEDEPVGQGVLKVKGYTWGKASEGSIGGLREKMLAEDVASALRAQPSKALPAPLHYQRAACALALLRWNGGEGWTAKPTATPPPSMPSSSAYQDLFDNPEPQEPGGH